MDPPVSIPVGGAPRPARDVDECLRRAAMRAGGAPSIHNTQPWRWRTRPGVLELWADRRRQLWISDPDGRMLTISCGAALHHARIELAAQGLHVTVVPFPDTVQRDLLALLAVDGNAPIGTPTIRLRDAIALRRTDRRPVLAQRMDDSTVQAIADAARPYGAFLHFLPTDRVAPLAALVATAQRLEAGADAWRAERDSWIDDGARPGTGVPDPNIPSRATEPAVALRDFGRLGTLPMPDAPHEAAEYAVLSGERDTPTEWLRAGEALSAAWLTANELDVSVMPISSVTEVPVTRRPLRDLLGGTGWPYLVLRLGLTDPREPGPPPTPRLSPDRTVSGSADA